MNDNICTDNRFEMIEKYLELLKQGTNIETSQEEMRTIQNILFRFWQMGWLDKIEFADTIVRCKDCKHAEAGEKDVWCELHESYKNKDGFCDEGERKETNER